LELIFPGFFYRIKAKNPKLAQCHVQTSQEGSLEETLERVTRHHVAMQPSPDIKEPGDVQTVKKTLEVLYVNVNVCSTVLYSYFHCKISDLQDQLVLLHADP